MVRPVALTLCALLAFLTAASSQPLQIPSRVDIGSLPTSSAYGYAQGTPIYADHWVGTFPITNISADTVDLLIQSFRTDPTIGVIVFKIREEVDYPIFMPLWHLAPGATYYECFKYSGADSGSSSTTAHLYYRMKGVLDSVTVIATTLAVPATTPFLTSVHIGSLEASPCIASTNQEGSKAMLSCGPRFFNPTGRDITVDSVHIAGDTLDFVYDQWLRSPYVNPGTHRLPVTVASGDYIQFSSIVFRACATGARNATLFVYCTTPSGRIVVTGDLAGYGASPNRLFWLSGDGGTDIIAGVSIVDSCTVSSIYNFIHPVAPEGRCGDAISLAFAFRGPRASALSVVGGDRRMGTDSMCEYAVRFCPTAADTPYSENGANPLNGRDTLFITGSMTGGPVQTTSVLVYTGVKRRAAGVQEEVAPEHADILTFPNPFADGVCISGSTVTVQSQIQIVDPLGRTVPGTVSAVPGGRRWSPAPGVAQGHYVAVVRNGNGPIVTIPLTLVR